MKEFAPSEIKIFSFKCSPYFSKVSSPLEAISHLKSLSSFPSGGKLFQNIHFPSKSHDSNTPWMYCTYSARLKTCIASITKTSLFKYTENFTTKKWKFTNKNSDRFHISAQNIDCGYSLKLPHWGSYNMYPQSLFLNRNKKNNVYPCKP